MAIYVFVLTRTFAEIGVIQCKIPIILNHILHKTQTKTRYDVTKMVYVRSIFASLIGWHMYPDQRGCQFFANCAKIA